MDKFKVTDEANKDFSFSGNQLPDMIIRFSPHKKVVAKKIFTAINKKILGAGSDVLFAIMKDNSKSAILDAIMQQVKSDKVFTYGITDVIGDKADIMLYKPNSKKGVRIAGKPGEYVLPKPFEKECKIPGISIHHKFIVIDFKGADPVVYCGSSNLAFDPEQKNGDNLIEIHDREIVTAFAIEAIRLVDHFHFRNAQAINRKKNANNEKNDKTLYLHDSNNDSWVDAFYDENDLKCLERKLLISPC